MSIDRIPKPKFNRWIFCFEWNWNGWDQKNIDSRLWIDRFVVFSRVVRIDRNQRLPRIEIKLKPTNIQPLATNCKHSNIYRHSSRNQFDFYWWTARMSALCIYHAMCKMSYNKYNKLDLEQKKIKTALSPWDFTCMACGRKRHSYCIHIFEYYVVVVFLFIHIWVHFICTYIEKRLWAQHNNKQRIYY